MNFFIVSRFDEESKEIEKELQNKLEEKGFFKSDSPQIVIAIGGDGTMLEAFRKFGTNSKYVGIHTGTLGFYADWKKEDIDELIDFMVKEKSPKEVEYPLISLKVVKENGEVKKYTSINEVIVKSKSLATFIMDVYINGNLFENFRGDGLIISTPTGSTAYNYSVLGSVLHPSLEVLQVAELAAINNAVYRTLNRSFVLPSHHVLNLKMPNVLSQITIGVDGVDIEENEVKEIFCEVSKEKMSFIRYKEYPFWQRVKEKFLN